MARGLALPPRLTDWTILGCVLAALTTGLLGLVSGRPGDWWVFAAHGAVGFALVVLLGWKFRRVYPRVARGRWTRETAVSVATAAVAVAALGTGVLWASGGPFAVGPFTLVTVHGLLGVALAPLLVVHLRHRFRAPGQSDFEGRRTAVKYGALAAVGVGAWGLQRVANRLLGTASAGRRFTGSRERGSFAGNAFPVTAWLADDPEPVNPASWTLTVDGETDRALSLSVADLDDRGGDVREATLDCTSGWYSTQRWRGVRVGRLLEEAGVDDAARHVRFESVTGYRWSLPVAEARDALLATRVGGEELSHGHGFPARLVAPGRRGFQWVKWVERVEVRRDPDPGQWAAIFLSGLW